MSVLTIRPATTLDAGLILTLLGELAGYEKLLEKFTLTEARIVRDFFGPQAAIHCELAFEDAQPVGIVTWYQTYASFAAVRGIFVEDLFVRPARRGKGHGKALLRHLAAKAATMGASRLDWLVLDWNAPAIEFYKSLGARAVAEWKIYRLEGAAMQRLGKA